MSYLKHKPGSIEEIVAKETTKLNDNAYQDMFKKELEKAGKGIGAMTPAEKKAFFNKIDDKYKAKNEAVDNPYAVGMAAAMKKTGMPYSILKQVYDRGMAAWKGGHRPGATQVQWALARVNSFVTKSSGTWGGADKDLAKKVRGK